MNIRHSTVRSKLDHDEGAFGIAVAVFPLAEGDVAWDPDNGGRGGKYRITGPCVVRYTRMDGVVKVRTL